MLSGDPNKIIHGTQVDPELAAIATAISSKFDTANMGTIAQLAIGSGTAGAPSYAFNSDLTTGWYLSAVGILAAATGGVQRITIGSAGAVTINAPSAGTGLTIAGGGLSVTGASTVGALTTGALSSTTGTFSGLVQVNAGGITVGMALDSTAANGSFFKFTNTGAQMGYIGSAKAVMAASFALGALAVESAAVLYLASNNAAFPSMALDASQAVTILQGRGPVAAALVDMTPDTSTFTGTFKDTTAAGTTGTVRWHKMGNQVTLILPTATFTSQNTDFFMTGLPASITPARNQFVSATAIGFEDNSAVLSAAVDANVQTSGQINFAKAASINGWTGAGTKGVANVCALSYSLV